MKKILLIYIILLSTIAATAQKKDTIRKITSDTLIFEKAQVDPQFPGGMAALSQYILKKMKLIDDKNNSSGKIFIDFVVEKDGSLTNITVIKSSLSNTINKEAIRVLGQSPKWIPGTVAGHIVRVRYITPIIIN